jgi:hypothetical protein
MGISILVVPAAAIGRGWQSVGGQLLASAVIFVSGYQDVGLRALIGAAFWFFMALAFSVSSLVTALVARLWGGATISAVALGFEIWLIMRWRRRGGWPSL